MICLIRSVGAGRIWARYRQLSEARFLGNFVVALALVLLLRELR